MSRRSTLALLIVSFLSLAHAQEREVKIDAAHVKVGQVYHWKLAAQNESSWEIVSVKENEVRYRIRLVVAGKEAPAKEAVSSLRRKAEGKEPAGEKETLKVSGIEFPCVILETESGGTVVKMWRTGRFPEVVKVQLGKDVTAELVSIDAPR
jgi:hypothetical protein